MRRKRGVSGDGRADAKAEKLREFGKFEGARKGQGDSRDSRGGECCVAKWPQHQQQRAPCRL